MTIISHRGNLNGPDLEKENTPEHIIAAINSGYVDGVEIDIWFFDGRFYLGHDKPMIEIDESFIVENFGRLWLHSKTVETDDVLSNLIFKVQRSFDIDVMYPDSRIGVIFSQITEGVVRTNKHYKIYHSLQKSNYRYGILVLPELIYPGDLRGSLNVIDSWVYAGVITDYPVWFSKH
jgi:hypothetical protein